MSIRVIIMIVLTRETTVVDNLTLMAFILSFYTGCHISSHACNVE